MQIQSLTSRLLIAAALLVSTLTTHAQQPSPNLSGIAHVALRVHDLDASIAFYEKLGFVKAFALSRDGAVYEAFIKINDRQFLELYPPDAKNTQIGFLHVCFEGNDLHSAHDYYVSQGLKPNDVRTAGAGNLLFTMPGPASPTGPQNMEYTQYMPGSLHSKDVGQHLGPDRIATKLTIVAIAVDDPAAAHSFYVDKLHFTGAPGKSLVTLPGTPDASLDIIPADPLGFKARLTFVADPTKAATTLKSRNIPFAKTKVASHPALTLTDPDANQIVLTK
jgi:catechol 2,3-dioxygenase-like lactoylglutathione lyase family enzyme